MTGYSSVIPLPPSTSRQTRAISSAARHVVALHHAHVGGPEPLGCLEARDLEGHKLHARDLRQHFGELRLHELV